MALSDLLFGAPAQTQQFQNFSPQQQNLQNRSIAQALSLLNNNMAGGLNFQPIAEKYKKQFSQETIPLLQERFSALTPTAQGQRSSALTQLLGSAASDLNTNLAALESQYNLQKAGVQNQGLNSLLSFGMQPSYSTLFQPAEHGLFGYGLRTLLEALSNLSVGTSGSGGLSALFGLQNQQQQPIFSKTQSSYPQSGEGFLNPAISGHLQRGF